MIRVLHISGCGDAGGISSVIRNYYQFIDHEKVHFDLALTVPTAGQNAHALEAMGAKIFFLPLKSENMQGFRQELTRLLLEGKYNAIHVHESETSYVALRIAKQLGIPCRIAHAHSSSPYEGVRGVLRRWSGCIFNYHYASHVIACGRLAGRRVFGAYNMMRRKALILPNAVDTEQFGFRPEIRQKMRKELGVEKNYVLGMVARLSEEKNIPFAIEIMGKLVKKIPDAVLLIAGNGECEQMIRDKIRRCHMEKSVRLLGRRADVADLYQAFDLFLLPSFFEGFPVVAVEAMSSGLPVLISSRVTDELKFGSAVQYLSLKNMDSWVEAAEKWQHDEKRALRQKEIPEHNLDIRSCAEILLRVYEEDTARSGQ